MKPATNLWVTLALLSVSPLLLAQDRSPIPPDSSEILGPDLVAWSHQQKPHPVTSPNAPEPNPVNSEAVEASTARILPGTIIRDRAVCVLRIGSNNYQLDDQQKVKAFEGRKVKLVGVLDERTYTVHVVSIELIS